jgi:hypothetical protein
MKSGSQPSWLVEIVRHLFPWPNRKSVKISQTQFDSDQPA